MRDRSLGPGDVRASALHQDACDAPRNNRILKHPVTLPPMAENSQLQCRRRGAGRLCSGGLWPPACGELKPTIKFRGSLLNYMPAVIASRHNKLPTAGKLDQRMCGMPIEKTFKVIFSADYHNEDRKLIFPDIGLSLLDADPNVTYEFLPEYRAEYVAEQLAGADALITLKPRVTAASLQGIEQLCAIGRCGVGYDNVDLAACTEHDIAVYITPAGVMRPMASSIVLMVLALSHNLVAKDQMVRSGRWVESTRKLGREPRGRTVGTIGLGNIAAEAVRLLAGFDVARFLAFDPYITEARAAEMGVERVSLDDLLLLSDYVLVNCPYTAATRHLIGERELGLMKSTAFLINTARGAIIDQAALIRALESKAIAGAGLDVFEREPLESDSPLLKLENVILTSHSVGWSEELFRDMGRIDCEGALAVSQGKAPSNVVNRDVLDRPGFLKKLQRCAERRKEVVK
jgi:phosphoglycerate dehydrogenase-like enzyme